MCDDDWVNKAIGDDSLVVDLLLRLHHSPPPPPAKPAPSLNLDWTVRQRRSRSAIRHADKKAEPARASPTTPLSWSGATSASAGTGAAADSPEESSRPSKSLKTSRSKVANPSETTTNKKSRRKKTLAELKEDENLLLKERRNLKTELVSLRLTVERHRATNERLKKMKLDLESRQDLKTATTSVASKVDQPDVLEESKCHTSHSVPPTGFAHVAVDNINASCKADGIGNQEASFMLPDLNLPVDGGLSSNCIQGLS